MNNPIYALTLLLVTFASSPALADGGESYPDPVPVRAAEVRGFVAGWLAAQSPGGAYDIPERAGHDVTGVRGDFHTVHQRDEDTYFVCVDFTDGDAVYDVDFIVDFDSDGLRMADHYLHKIDGVVLED